MVAIGLVQSREQRRKIRFVQSMFLFGCYVAAISSITFLKNPLLRYEQISFISMVTMVVWNWFEWLENYRNGRDDQFVIFADFQHTRVYLIKKEEMKINKKKNWKQREKAIKSKKKRLSK